MDQNTLHLFHSICKLCDCPTITRYLSMMQLWALTVHTAYCYICAHTHKCTMAPTAPSLSLPNRYIVATVCMVCHFPWVHYFVPSSQQPNWMRKEQQCHLLLSGSPRVQPSRDLLPKPKPELPTLIRCVWDTHISDKCHAHTHIKPQVPHMFYYILKVRHWSGSFYQEVSSNEFQRYVMH